MIHSDSFTIGNAWYSIDLRCNICEAREWGTGTIYSYMVDDGERETLSFLVSKAEAHWNQIHASKEEED